MSFTQESAHEKAMQHIPQVIPAWGKLTKEQLQLDRLTGVTNQIFLAKHDLQDIEPKEVIYRILGRECEGSFIKREDEMKVMAAFSEAGIGPKLFGYTQEYRVEEYMNSWTLKQSDAMTPEWRRKLALKLGKLHQVNVDLDRTPRDLGFLTQFPILKEIEEKCKNKDKLFDEEEMKQVEEMSIWFKEEEKQFLFNNLPKTEKSVILAHNDLHALNALVLKSDGNLKLCDFEYSSYNYRAYDIANYFNELCYDYEYKEYPYFKAYDNNINENDVKDFVKYYMISFLNADYDNEKIVKDDNYFNQVVQNIGLEKFNKECEEIFAEIPISILFSHYLWGSWSIHLAKVAKLEFDYLLYGYARFEQYKKYKKLYFQKK